MRLAPLTERKSAESDACSDSVPAAPRDAHLRVGLCRQRELSGGRSDLVRSIRAEILQYCSLPRLGADLKEKPEQWSVLNILREARGVQSLLAGSPNIGISCCGGPHASYAQISRLASPECGTYRSGGDSGRQQFSRRQPSRCPRAEREGPAAVLRPGLQGLSSMG